MPYTPTTWTEGVTKLGPTNMNHLETGISNVTTTADAAIAKPSSPASSDGLVWNGSTWVNAKLVNANIDPAAAIVYSKLSLAGGIVNNDVSASAAIAASKLANYPTDPDQVLKGDGTWGRKFYRKTTTKTVNTSTATTDLLNGEITVGAGLLGTTSGLRLTAWGDFLQNSGGAIAGPRFLLVFGGTTLIDTNVPPTVANSATRSPWKLVAEIINLGSASLQSCIFDLDISAAGGWTTGAVNLTTGEGVYSSVYDGAVSVLAKALGYNTSAVNTANAAALVFDVINGSASGTYETKLAGAIVEVL